MKSGITRWKMVPSYSGTPCFLAPEGLVQSFVPLARPTKFSTPTGATFGNNVQCILPAVVSMIASGSVAGGLVAGVVVAGVGVRLGVAVGAGLSGRTRTELRMRATAEV